MKIAKFSTKALEKELNKRKKTKYKKKPSGQSAPIVNTYKPKIFVRNRDGAISDAPNSEELIHRTTVADLDTGRDVRSREYEQAINYKPILSGFVPSIDALGVAEKLRKDAALTRTAGEIAVEKMIVATGWPFQKEQVVFVSDEKHYRLDFLIGQKLAIEVDGKTHFNAESQERDVKRNADLLKVGICTIRLDYPKTITDGNKFVIYFSNASLEETERWARVLSSRKDRKGLRRKLALVPARIHDDFCNKRHSN